MKRILFIGLMVACTLRTAAQQAVAVLPFELANNAIILNVKLNDQPQTLRLIFDTGASGLAVSDSLAKILHLQVTADQQTSVVGGQHHISISAHNTAHLDGVTLDDASIGIFSGMKPGVDGIIGNGLLRHYIVRTDMNAKRIYLYTPGKAPAAKGAALHFDMETGVPVVAGQLNLLKDQPLDGHFVFDTGAGYSLICFRPFVVKQRLLVSGFKPERMASTSSLGKVTPTFEGHAAMFTLPPLKAIPDLPVSLMGGTGNDQAWQPGVDGSIGMQFIGRYNFTIDLGQQTIYLEPLTL